MRGITAATDWNMRRYITHTELVESPALAAWVRAQPRVWRQASDADVVWNMAHPANVAQLANDLLKGIV